TCVRDLPDATSGKDDSKKGLTIALAGNSNVGKSVIFNYLTGLHQHVGNWPGKTVEKAEGSLHFKGYNIDVIDLPGIYSFSTFSMEEVVSRQYIAFDKPDVVINVVDSCVLERNLFLTLQLIEMHVPVVVALNMVDSAKKKGIVIDEKRLSEFLGVPVVPTVGIKGVGIDELVETAIETAKGNIKTRVIEYGKEIEDKVKKLEKILENFKLNYPARYVALKLLEEDKDIQKEVRAIDSKTLRSSEEYAKEIEQIHGEPCSVVISYERYAVANRFSKEVQKTLAPTKLSLTEKIDQLLMHRILGYVILVAAMFAVFYAVFTFGGFLSAIISKSFDIFRPATLGIGQTILWEGVIGGFVAAVTLVLPYVLPFYLLLTLLEDTGYLPRIAFLLDNIMHKMGLHGKAIIPMIMGYGCNVPACYACRIMETQRDRLIAAFVITFIPCTARIIVILGLVATFVNIQWAFTLLLIDLAIIFAMGRIAFKVLPGESMGLIMELHPLRAPSRHIFTQTWVRIKSIVYLVFPIYIVGGAILAIMQNMGFLAPLDMLFSLVTVDWLGLPSNVSVLLVFGLLRKELVMVMPTILFGTTNLAAIFTPIQMIVLAFVTMIYAPCFATIAMLKREFGWRKASYISLFELVFAIFLGGLFFRVLQLIM
ncbi:MAG: ferrous iron transport protein B, partial [Candidatus Bathyarchaeota archaeon]